VRKYAGSSLLWQQTAAIGGGSAASIGLSVSPTGHVLVAGGFQTTASFGGIQLTGAGSSNAFVAELGGQATSIADTPVQLIDKSSKQCLDVKGYSGQPDAPAIQYWCEGGRNQQWLPKAVGDGSYQLIVQNSGYSLDVRQASKAAGAAVVQYPYWNGPNQHWYFQTTSDGFYNLVSQNSGMCLDLIGGVTAGADAWTQQAPCNTANSQKWSLVPLQ
jgi:hypothetical protein